MYTARPGRFGNYATVSLRIGVARTPSGAHVGNRRPWAVGRRCAATPQASIARSASSAVARPCAALVARPSGRQRASSRATAFFAFRGCQHHLPAMVAIPEMPCNPTLERLLQWKAILATGGLPPDLPPDWVVRGGLRKYSACERSKESAGNHEVKGRGRTPWDTGS
jgi:hypothetical protein